MISIPAGLGDAALEELMLAGARGVPVAGTLSCCEAAPRYVATPERRADALQSLMACAAELLRRRASRALLCSDPINSPMQMKDRLHEYFAQHEAEAFAVLFLNAQHAPIAFEEMFRGTLTQTAVYPREIVKRALALNACAVVLAHNHPSGIAEPSRADELITQTVKTALALVDVRVIDHIVAGRNCSTSFAERGLL